MNDASAIEGDFLLSLDSDLYQHPVLIKYSVLVQALFARRVCLTDTQIIESPALEDFFLNNKNELTGEIQQADASVPPMLGTCTRKHLGADILAVIDSMLEPNSYTGFPAYSSRLTPEQNVALRAGFDQLRTPEHRRRAFLDVAGRRTEQYLKNASIYFEQHPLAVVRGTGDQQRPLFDTVREKLDILNAPKNRKRLKRIDHTIRDTLLKEIDSHPDAQTRERLHLVIYNGKLPHYHKGQLEPMDDPDALKRHDWRHMINTFYNFNLAEKYRSRPVLNSQWFDIPRRLTAPRDRRVAASLKKVGEVKLETPIYPEHLTVPFVASVRRENDFWKTITRMEKAHNQREYTAAFEDHLRLISSHLAQHLKDSGHADLLKTPIAEVMMELLPKTVAYCALVEAAVGIWYGLPWKSLAGASLTVAGGATVVIKNFIARLPIKVTNPHFKSFEAEMALVARKSGLTT